MASGLISTQDNNSLPVQRSSWAEAGQQREPSPLTADSRPCSLEKEVWLDDWWQSKSRNRMDRHGAETSGGTAGAGVSASIVGSLRTAKFKCEHCFLPVRVSILSLQGSLQGKAVMMKNPSVLLKLLFLLLISGKNNNFYLNTTCIIILFITASLSLLLSGMTCISCWQRLFLGRKIQGDLFFFLLPTLAPFELVLMSRNSFETTVIILKTTNS